MLGDVLADPAFNGMTQQTLDTPVAPNDCWFRICRWTQAPRSYVGLGVVLNGYTITDDTYLLVALRTLDAPECGWKILVKFPNSGCPVGNNIQSPAGGISYSKEIPPPPMNALFWNAPGALYTVPALGNPDAWLLTTRFARGVNSWSAELKIPKHPTGVGTGGIYFPPIGTNFKLCVNVVVKTGGVFTTQLAWPDTDVLTGTDVHRDFPAWDTWCDATFQ